ncbi:proton-conducting transporter membrane subunit [Celeribacter neptunius]|uniref:Formate hydrogenlyase subunit 3/Multisubunit Na+/H+ antiporter, MnhD subunit n=1 Tax=Celeribacter neptunius TaxID=588602 RepID=A0A1I3N927_9RHOB|nr:proton-conducting transporter membrane subunit [Celeribacter neptunius]SFJ05687.1 Formate hydrogenlyase subunit 3/Multisubunit Na+/H+ antiporter, MnhD subunit [Celeribacter neptunius]
MVSPLLILAAGLGAAFLLGLLRQTSERAAFYVTIAALGFMGFIALSWTVGLALGDALPVMITTAGTAPPFAINLFMGGMEAALISVVTLTGLLSAFYMRKDLLRLGRRVMAVLLVLIMALSGLIMTRDLFNLFVFIELIVIASAGLILLSRDTRALGAGFKYLVVSQVISILLLVGVIFTYHANGSLNIDDIPARPMVFTGASLAIFLVLIALVLELKPFPANGWALDIYESAHPGFSAIFSAASGTAAAFAAFKLFDVAGPAWLPLATGIGIVTFVGANLLALAQSHDRRLLGYSSVGQIGLVLMVIGQADILGATLPYVAGGILISHAVAKSGLFWLSGLVKGRELSDWAALRDNPVLIVAFATFIAMLTGLPPFPAFYAKWALVHALMANGAFALTAAFLIAALIEAAVLFRWFGMAIKRESRRAVVVNLTYEAVVLLAMGTSFVLSWIWGAASGQENLITLVPLLFALLFLPLDIFPAKAKNLLAIAGLVVWFALSFHGLDPIRLVFLIIMVLGGALLLLASFHAEGRRMGFYTPAMLMFAGMALLITSETSFQFFAAWEFLTVGSYFLILRGHDSEPHALSYIVFSLGGAFALLAGFALASGGKFTFFVSELSEIAPQVAPYVFVLLAIGFLTKTAVMGLHIWLPGAHAEAETDVSPMVSGILLKAGLFGLFILLLEMGHQTLYGIDLTVVLVWLGALSAFVGAVLAAFQEDAKRLLAYSSISQMGYAVFGLALMNHLGWLLALMFAINHFVYKSMLFLAVGGVKERTHTKLMYKMGGLITLMPYTFVSVLVGIIAMSGVPPLSGFGGRWIFYNAIMSTDLRLPMILVFMSGPVGFLYLFRLIHSIFLGQPKDELRMVKEAPFWIVAPQMLFVAFLIAFAALPGMILRRVDGYIGQIFGDQPLTWSGRIVDSQFGTWNPVAIWGVIAVVFITILLLLIWMNHNAQRVKQFNIVFSAERPFKPQTTHFAWNFFAPYRKAMGFLEAPIATGFWTGVSNALHGTAEFTRKFYTGNGQTYAVQLLLFVVAVYLIVLGSMGGAS